MSEGAVDVVGLARAGVAFALCDEVSHEIVAVVDCRIVIRPEANNNRCIINNGISRLIIVTKYPHRESMGIFIFGMVGLYRPIK